MRLPNFKILWKTSAFLIFGMAVFLHQADASFITQGKPYFTTTVEMFDAEDSDRDVALDMNELMPPEVPAQNGNSEFAVSDRFAGSFGSDSGGIAEDFWMIAQSLEKFWEILQKGRPIVNANSVTIKALPEGANNNWQALNGWKPMRFVNFHYSVQNAYNVTVIDLWFQARLLFGGSLKGKGQYIAAATIIPTSLNVLWGYELSMTGNVDSVVDVGAKGFPVAAVTLNIGIDAASPIYHEYHLTSILMQGDGYMFDLNHGKVLHQGPNYPALAKAKRYNQKLQ